MRATQRCRERTTFLTDPPGSACDRAEGHYGPHWIHTDRDTIEWETGQPASRVAAQFEGSVGEMTPITWGRVVDLLTGAGYPTLQPATVTPPCPAERPFGPCTQRCEQPSGHEGQHRAQCFTWDEYMCTCPAYRFNEQGDVEGLPQGTNPDCRLCHPEDQQ